MATSRGRLAGVSMKIQTERSWTSRPTLRSSSRPWTTKRRWRRSCPFDELVSEGLVTLEAVRIVR
jgi:hypothetical protein